MSRSEPGRNGLDQGELEQGDLNLLWATAFVDEVAAAGVTTFLIAPGSRSTPLVLAADANPLITSVVHVDERSAAFFALGVGKASGTPAAVITTSGTAVANLFPAVVEAAQSETPLLLLTADRPPRLRGTDANQTIDQERIFGSYPVEFHDAGVPSAGQSAIRALRDLAIRSVTQSIGPPAGPVHVNFPFEKPLHPAVVDVARMATPATSREAPQTAGRSAGEAGEVSAPDRLFPDPAPQDVSFLGERIEQAERGLVVAGPTPGGGVGDARSLARATGFPVLADPLSGARFQGRSGGVTSVDHYDLLLRDSVVRAELRPDFVIRVGRAPTSSTLNDFISESRAEVIVVDPGGRWRDHTGAATSYVTADPTRVAIALAERLTESENGPGEPAAGNHAWVDAWRRADAAAEAAIRARVTEAVELPTGAAEPVVTRAAVRALPAEGVLFVSSSMPVRDVDAYVPGDRVLGCLGNRGASGIDGIASTALGSCFATGRQTLVLLGDLAFIHDLNGLIPAADLALPVVFVVVNNCGGGIFHMLPIRDHEPAFTRYFATPHQVNFQHVGGLYDLPFRRVPAGQIEDAVLAAFASGGTHILEVRSDREDNRRWRSETVDAVRARVADALELSTESDTVNQTQPETR